ncbi:MAG: hypothetical protein IT330_16990 [Anaerolineae bacterium]|nr:hypothetical protein [Anaerolineae bacterium]
MEKREWRGPGLVWPVILIGAGIVFLLNNMGLLAWDVWETIFRLWPVLLIAIGLEILVGRRSAWASLLVVVLLLAAMAGGIWYLSGTNLAPRSGTDLQTVKINESLEGATSADVEIGFGAGTMRLEALTEATAKLIEGSVVLGSSERLINSHRGSGDTARYTLRTEGAISFFPFFGRWGREVEDRIWDLRLNRDIPLRLTVDTGAGQSILNLERLNLTRLDVNTGVGQTTVTIPARGRFRAQIDAGVGEVIIRIPEGMAARIQVDTGLGGVSAGSTFRQQGDTYTTRDYDTAENRVDMEVNGGIGRISITEYRGQ